MNRLLMVRTGVNRKQDVGVMSDNGKVVKYEDFGAVGNGVSDDLPAICEAHAHANANAHQLRVEARPDATYHLGRRALTAVIATDTDWSTARFTIDDTEVDDHTAPLFHVRSLLEPEAVLVGRLTRDQKQLDARPDRDLYVLVKNEDIRLYIRRGLNQNQGVPQQDCFILYRDGTIEGEIDWAYDSITHLTAYPVDDTPLVIRGGVFTTFGNRMQQEVGYNYWARNIEITRSNTEVDGLTHYVAGETATGHPYRGFLSANECANITFRNCFVTGHKTYSTIGAAGKPVKMGSYDLHANSVVNLKIINCRMNHICDRTRWGVIGTNFCKNILLEDCTLSRMDTHMGVSGRYIARRCTFGHMGFKAIGRGELVIDECTLYGQTLVEFRQDYGSTWEGDLTIRNCRWVPACGDETRSHIIGVSNDGMHDFGYPCSMPRTVKIDGLLIDDGNTPASYDGPFLFADPDAGFPDGDRAPRMAERPFPYVPCQTAQIQGIVTSSGKGLRVSPNSDLSNSVRVSLTP